MAGVSVNVWNAKRCFWNVGVAGANEVADLARNWNLQVAVEIKNSPMHCGKRGGHGENIVVMR